MHSPGSYNLTQTHLYSLVSGNSAAWGAGGVAQNLSYDESTAALSISSGNTISLSALSAAPVAPTDLHSPGPIGDVTPNTGAFTEVDGQYLVVDGGAGGSGAGYGTIQAGVHSSASEAGLLLDNNGTGGRRYTIISTNDLSGIGAGKFAIGDATAGLGRFVINMDGNVGIGEINPDHKLTVSGDVYATSLIGRSDTNVGHALEIRSSMDYGVVLAYIDDFGVIFSTAGDSNQWQGAFTTVWTNSANWNNTYTAFSTQSAANASVYSTVNAQSAANASVYSTVNAYSGTLLVVLTAAGTNLNKIGGTVLLGTDLISIQSINLSGGVNPTQSIYNLGTLTGTAASPFIVQQTFNNAALTGAVMTVNLVDTSSAAASRVFDVQKNGSSLFTVDKTGQTYVSGHKALSYSGGIMTLVGTDGTTLFLSNGVNFAGALYFGQSTTNGSFQSDGTGNIAMRGYYDSTQKQNLTIYNTYTSTTNFERGNFGWNSVANSFIIGSEAGSGGGIVRDLLIQTGGTTRISVSATGAISLTSALSTNSLITGNGGFTSADWDSARTTVNSNSAAWGISITDSNNVIALSMFL